MTTVAPTGRKRRSDATQPPCTSCGGSRHQHNKELVEDFRCWWTQFSSAKYGLEDGYMVPLRKNPMIEFARWVEGNARPRPRRGPDGQDIPPDPDARVRFFE